MPNELICSISSNTEVPFWHEGDEIYSLEIDEIRRIKSRIWFMIYSLSFQLYGLDSQMQRLGVAYPQKIGRVSSKGDPSGFLSELLWRTFKWRLLQQRIRMNLTSSTTMNYERSHRWVSICISICISHQWYQLTLWNAEAKIASCIDIFVWVSRKLFNYERIEHLQCEGLTCEEYLFD